MWPVQIGSQTGGTLYWFLCFLASKVQSVEFQIDLLGSFSLCLRKDKEEEGSSGHNSEKEDEKTEIAQSILENREQIKNKVGYDIMCSTAYCIA